MTSSSGGRFFGLSRRGDWATLPPLCQSAVHMGRRGRELEISGSSPHAVLTAAYEFTSGSPPRMEATWAKSLAVLLGSLLMLPIVGAFGDEPAKPAADAAPAVNPAPAESAAKPETAIKPD